MIAVLNAAAVAGAQMPDPAVSYERPFDVVRDMTLTHDEKVEVLHRWLANVMARQDVTGADKQHQMNAVARALQFLGAPVDVGRR